VSSRRVLSSDTSERLDRTRSSLHQKARQTRIGLLFVRERMEHVTRIREYEYASEGTDAWGGKRECHWTDFVHRQPVWTGCLSATEIRTSHPSYLFVSLCNTAVFQILDKARLPIPIAVLATSVSRSKTRKETVSWKPSRHQLNL
jgi:hypothetical protein